MELGEITQDELTCWAPFGDDAEVQIRFITREELDRLKRKVTTKTFRRGQILEDIDTIEFNRLLGRAAVRGWKNITVGGRPFEYSPENCDILMTRSYEFSDFVNDKCVEINTFIETRGEESKKKSGPTPAGG